MPLGTEIGLGPGDIVLDGDPAPSPHRVGHRSPQLLGPCLLCPNGRPSQQLLSSCTGTDCVGCRTMLDLSVVSASLLA